jgi:hypothetical protein
MYANMCSENKHCILPEINYLICLQHQNHVFNLNDVLLRELPRRAGGEGIKFQHFDRFETNDFA